MKTTHLFLRAGLPGLFVLSVVDTAFAREVPVASTGELMAALSAAAAGDTIILAPGSYPMTGASCAASGTGEAPIVVKSATPLAAKIRLNSLEGFKVTGAHWQFEGLDITGVCAADNDCEHAFHVSGAASGFVLRNSRVFDFNAQLKVNSSQVGGTWRTPHAGLVEGNEIADSHARDTDKPTTKLNIDTGDGWIVRANYIHDAHKGGGDNISYAAFMKSGGKDGLFERNLVICSNTDTTGGTRIGLSFGGGGTGAQYCAPAFNAATPCDPEHTNGTMRNNIIVNCSDVGIYLNKARGTKLLFNTLIGTAGIDFRFASSTGEADGNVLSSIIRAREGATFTNETNLTNVQLFSSWYVDPSHGNLSSNGDLAALLQAVNPRADVTDDYCARPRTGSKLDLGALQHSLGDCDTTRPPVGALTPQDDAGAQTELDSGVLMGADAGAQGSLADAAAEGLDSGRMQDAVDGAALEGSPVERGSDRADGGCSAGHAIHQGPGSWLLPLCGLGTIVALRRRRIA